MMISVLLGLNILLVLGFAPLMKPSLKLYYFKVMVFKACGLYFKEQMKATQRLWETQLTVGNQFAIFQAWWSWTQTVEGKTSEWTERYLNLEYLHSNVTPHFVTERRLDNLSGTISLQRLKADFIIPFV